MLSPLESQVSYFVNTYPLEPDRQGVTIGFPPADTSLPTFYIQTLTFNESTINPVTSGQMVLTYPGFFATNAYSYLKEGDILKIYEVFGEGQQSQSMACRFTGYIASIRFDYSLEGGSDSGTKVTIFFYNLLGQWAIQAAASNINQQISQGLTNLNSNQVPLGQVLNQLVQGSLFEKLIQLGQFSTNSVSYNGTSLPVKIGNTELSLDSSVWAYIATNMTKQVALEKILYPYQQVFYQEANGIIVIDLLKPLKNANPQFDFSYMIPTSNSVNASSLNFTSMQVVHAAAMVPNKVISTLINLPFVPPTEGVPQNYIASITNPFSRPSQLQKSGFFEILNVQQDTLSSDMITDPTLLAYLTGGIASTGYALEVLSGQPTIAGTYAARRLAQANFQETGVFISQPRIMAKSAGLTPLGTMVSFNAPSFSEPGINSMYCYGTSTSFVQGQGTIFTLQLCKQGCVTSYWQPAS